MLFRSRLNSDGSLDTTFDPQAGASAVVRVVVADGPADGTSKYLVGGDFTGPSFGVAVTNKSLTANVATLTTAGNHGFNAADLENNIVTVNLGDAVFDGTFTLASASGNTLTYNRTNANVASTTVSPRGLVGLAGRPANRLAMNVCYHAPPGIAQGVNRKTKKTPPGWRGSFWF